MRLQVFLSHNGVCSRRAALKIIFQGRVSVNNHVIREPSCTIDAGKDNVLVDGKRIKQKIYRYIMLNKPTGVVTTKKDRFAKMTVFDLLPEELRHLHPVGRLDKDTEGLLLLTNDGPLTYRLTHPKFAIEKTYYVFIKGHLSLETKNKLEKGMILEGKKTSPAKIEQVKGKDQQTEFYLILHEGRKRQIRLMLEQCGFKVIYLKRIKQGPLVLGSLKPGSFRELSREEVYGYHH